jgi:MFS family permease
MTFGVAHTSAGKAVQVLQPGMELSGVYVHVRSRQFDLWRCTELQVSCSRTRHCWSGQCGSVRRWHEYYCLSTPPHKRPIMMALVGTTYAISAVLGPLIRGAFTDKVSWRWCFYINLPAGGIAALSIFFFFLHLPAAAAPPAIPWSQKLLHLDPVGIALAMGGITSFVAALQYGGSSHPWASGVVIGLLVGSALIASVLVAWEIWLGEYAIMLPRLWRHRWLSATAAYQFFFMGSYIVLLYYLPIYFQSILGASPI